MISKGFILLLEDVCTGKNKIMRLPINILDGQFWSTFAETLNAITPDENWDARGCEDYAKTLKQWHNSAQQNPSPGYSEAAVSLVHIYKSRLDNIFQLNSEIFSCWDTTQPFDEDESIQQTPPVNKNQETLQTVGNEIGGTSSAHTSSTIPPEMDRKLGQVLIELVLNKLLRLDEVYHAEQYLSRSKFATLALLSENDLIERCLLVRKANEMWVEKGEKKRRCK